MGCTFSKSEPQLGKIEPWNYQENGMNVVLSKEQLEDLRNEFWANKNQGTMTVWHTLHQCCDLMLQDKANDVLSQQGLTVVSGNLSIVRDVNGAIYEIEKYCYSTPSNVATEDEEAPAVENNKFRFRIGAVSFLDEEREIIFVFDPEGQRDNTDVTPAEHSPASHRYYDTYHFSDNLQTITEKEVSNKVVNAIQNFPEVAGKINVTGVRLFYLGHELKRDTPFVLNHIPFDSVIVVLVQCL